MAAKKKTSESALLVFIRAGTLHGDQHPPSIPSSSNPPLTCPAV
jgi:hypothetical protein